MILSFLFAFSLLFPPGQLVFSVAAALEKEKLILLNLSSSLFLMAEGSYELKKKFLLTWML